jgi:catechol-2,3-dioxygenase
MVKTAVKTKIGRVRESQLKIELQNGFLRRKENMTNKKMPQLIGVRHVGLSAQNPAVLAGFYHDVLGLDIVPTDTAALGPNVFLSSHREQGSLDLAFFANPVLQHIAFEVSSLAELRAFHQRIIDRGLPIKLVLNHGVSLSFYFADPEGHMIEIYWPTGIACIPRHGEPVDLTRSEEEVLETIGGSSERSLPS